MAAVMACGEGAVLSGRAAGYLLGLLKGPAPAPEVTAPDRPACQGRQDAALAPRPEDATTWRGIPVTTVPRTLVDLAAYLPTDDLARACHEAGVRHRTTPAMVEAVLARRPNSPGATKLRHDPAWRGPRHPQQARSALSGAAARRDSSYRRPTARRADGASTAAGPSTA